MLYKYFLHITTNQYRTMLHIGFTNNIQNQLSHIILIAKMLKNRFLENTAVSI